MFIVILEVRLIQKDRTNEKFYRRVTEQQELKQIKDLTK